MSDTPETDSRAWSDHSEGILHEVVEANFARKLERERDKAREDATNFYARIGELESERDTALRQLELTKGQLKVEREAARKAIDAAESERDKAYAQFYLNPDAAKLEREKAQNQKDEFERKWAWHSRAFAQVLKKNEELEEELKALKSQNESH